MTASEPSASGDSRLRPSQSLQPWWRREWTWRRAVECLRSRPKLAGAIGVYLICTVLIRFPFSSVTRNFRSADNPAIAEAEAWLKGRLDLAHRLHDTALYEGRVFCVHAPMYTMLSVLVLALYSDGIPRWVLIVLLGLPAPGLAYRMFLRRTQQVITAVVLSVAFICGTSFAPVLVRALWTGDVYTVNQIFSSVGLLILLAEFHGARRISVMGAGFALTLWSRTLTTGYALLMIWAAWTAAGHRLRTVTLTVGVILAAMAVPLAFNTAKFGSPLEFGYRYIYVGREDDYSRDAEGGIFSVRHLWRNLYYMNLGFPEVVERPKGPRLQPNWHGTGIWWTSPLLLLIFARWGVVWCMAGNRVVLMAAAFAFIGLSLYHGTGRSQWGYNRYSLDYIPALMAALAPACEDPRWRWVVLGCVAWSVVYFCVLIAQ